MGNGERERKELMTERLQVSQNTDLTSDSCSLIWNKISGCQKPEAPFWILESLFPVPDLELPLQTHPRLHCTPHIFLALPLSTHLFIFKTGAKCSEARSCHASCAPGRDLGILCTQPEMEEKPLTVRGPPSVNPKVGIWARHSVL